MRSVLIVEASGRGGKPLDSSPRPRRFGNAVRPKRSSESAQIGSIASMYLVARTPPRIRRRRRPIDPPSPQMARAPWYVARKAASDLVQSGAELRDELMPAWTCQEHRPVSRSAGPWRRGWEQAEARSSHCLRRRVALTMSGRGSIMPRRQAEQVNADARSAGRRCRGDGRRVGGPAPSPSVLT